MSSADELLDRLLAYSLFKKDLLSSLTNLQALIGDYFGVFVTIRRAHRLGKWPDDIHGCIGYWDPEFEALYPESLWSHAMEVGARATWEDARRHEFDHFLDRDPDSWLELDLMRRPLFPVDSATGQISSKKVAFTNDTYGLIVQHPGGERATYLPHVFPASMPWSELRDHLMAKGGLGTSELSSAVFYAYEITQYKRQFHQLLDTPRIGRAITQQYVGTLMAHKNNQRRYPFLYEVTRNGRRVFEDREDVRNLSTLAGVLRYDEAYGGEFLSSNVRSMLVARSKSILSKMNSLSPQALSFAGRLVEQKDAYCRRLQEALPRADPEFERGELLLGLRAAGCSPSADVQRVIAALDLRKEDSIFQMNWTTQAMAAWGRSFSALQRDLLLSVTEGLLQDSTETNQLAVAWEALCAMYSVDKNKALKDRIFTYFFWLERHRTSEGLYAFRNGDARVDITDHVLRGFLLLPLFPKKNTHTGGKIRRRTTRRNARSTKNRTLARK